MKTKKTVSMKVAVLMMAVVLLIGGAVGGTLAWLATKTTTVTNTFSASGIDIELTETSAKTFQLIPGKTYVKDPKVTVLNTTNVDCYLFVKFEEGANNAAYLTYESALTDTSVWTQVPGETNVWYQTVTATGADQSWYLLKGKGDAELKNGYMTVKNTVDAGTMSTAAASSLSYTAYAVQTLGFESDVAGAWAVAEALQP